MGETFITLWGNIATEPRAVETAGGLRITKFRLACTASRRDQQTGEFTDGVTSWYSVACFRDLGANVSASFIKGQPVFIYGKQVVREWESDGKRGTEVAIDAISVGHDLRWGQASFVKVRRGQGPAAAPASPVGATDRSQAGEGSELDRALASAAAPLTSYDAAQAEGDPWSDDYGPREAGLAVEPATPQLETSMT